VLALPNPPAAATATASDRGPLLSWMAGIILFASLAALSPVLGGFTLSVLTLVFLFGFFGQAWNLMTGLAGQLSLGHALYVGLGGYTVVLLSTRYGVSPWFGLLAGALIAALTGAATGWLGFRFSVRGFQFAILTIAFAEFARVMFDNWEFVGGTAGLFLPALPPHTSPLAVLRGGSQFFYLAALALAAVGTAVTAWIGRASLGYVWRAIRDDEEVARALGVRAFRQKIAATSLSAALTAVGGGLYGLLNGSLFPDSMMSLSLSIDIIICPIVGGLGTAFGPLIGALLVIPLTQSMSVLGARLGLYGLNNVVDGVVLIAVVWLLPQGIWPAIVAFSARWRHPGAELEAADAQ
jgi:branched-chain amino acid transport system permease protein